MIRDLFNNQVRTRPLIRTAPDPEEEQNDDSFLDGSTKQANPFVAQYEQRQQKQQEQKKGSVKREIFKNRKKPSKNAYLDEKSLKEKRENLRQLSQIGAFTSALSALADSAQLGSRTSSATTPYGANLTTGADQLLSMITQKEDRGNERYNNAILQWEADQANVDNQNRQLNYQEQQQQEQRIYNEEQQEEQRTENQRDRFKTQYYRMIEEHGDMDAFNKLAKQFGMPELEKGYFDDDKTNSTGKDDIETVYDDDNVEMGRRITLQQILSDEFSYLAGDALSKEATAVDQLSDEDKKEYYRQVFVRYQGEMQGLAKEMQTKQSWPEIERLSEKLASMLGALGKYSQDEIDQKVASIVQSVPFVQDFLQNNNGQMPQGQQGAATQPQQQPTQQTVPQPLNNSTGQPIGSRQQAQVSGSSYLPGNNQPPAGATAQPQPQGNQPAAGAQSGQQQRKTIANNGLTAQQVHDRLVNYIQRLKQANASPAKIKSAQRQLDEIKKQLK